MDDIPLFQVVDEKDGLKGAHENRLKEQLTFDYR